MLKKIICILLLFALILPTVALPFKPAVVLAEDKSILEQQLWALEQEIASFEKELASTKTQKKTLTNKINELKNKRTLLLKAVEATKINIKGTENQIDKTEDDLTLAGKELKTTQIEISQILRQIQQTDLMSSIKILFSSGSLADFFVNLEQHLSLNDQLSKKMTQEKAIVKKISNKINQLQDKKVDLTNLLSIQKLQEGEIVQTQKEKESLLQTTLGKESEFQKIVSDQKKKAAEVRNRLYEMAAIKAITFGEAVKEAEWVTQYVKIRPALLLSVITQESNLGKNVGTCNRPTDPPEKHWKKIMKPERDQQPFLDITAELGINPEGQPLSCPMKDAKGKQLGWGGAMGPAQFIPSTWQGYKKKVMTVTGQTSANPWDIRDAFVASALLLAANGATSQTETGEWKAAMIYFSGSTNKKYKFYGDSVIKRADQYEEDIKSLKAG
ncbi:MAG: hypothetical protein AAB666_02210 [Patescibacteria group bacterium]